MILPKSATYPAIKHQLATQKMISRFCFAGILVACFLVPIGVQAQSEFPARTLAQVKKDAKAIDKFIQQHLKSEKVTGQKAVKDPTFLRRVYLDSIGRAPSAAEARAFLTAKVKNKRSILVDKLLNSPGYASHEFNVWSDILRVKSRLSNRVSGEPYMDWLKQSFDNNLPFDKMVHEMITATGPSNKRGNGATGYLLRDPDMPRDTMANTVRIFMGTRLECAQCHNHPFQQWTQKQFFEMTAYLGGLRYRADFGSKAEARALAQAGQKLRKSNNQQAFRTFRRQVLSILQSGIGGSGTGFAMLPEDYQYDDLKPLSLLSANTMMGESAEVNTKLPKRMPKPRGNAKTQARRIKRFLNNQVEQVDSRKIFADWLTSKENPLFTKVAVSREWERLFGRGLIEPIGDIREDTKSSHPELLEHLVKHLQELNFNMKEFKRSLLNTRAYQSKSIEPIVGGNPHFAGPNRRRLSAEQLWDSMLTTIVPHLDDTLVKHSAKAEALYDRYDELAGKSVETLVSDIQEAVSTGGGSPQGMQRAAQKKRRTETRGLFRELRTARQKNDLEKENEIVAKLEAMGLDADRFFIQRTYGNKMLRASELKAPEDAGHLLRQFGQSDREQNSAGHTNAAVPQVLNLMNGFIEKNILGKKNAHLLSGVRNAKNPKAKIRLIYLSLLSRFPTKSELANWSGVAEEEGDDCYRDLIWILMNSHEYRFIL